HRKVPSSLYMPARSKAYFVTRHGQDDARQGATALKRALGTMRADVRRHRDAGRLSWEAASRLEDEIRAGFEEGVAEGRSQPRTRQSWTVPKPLVRFPPRLLPARRLHVALACQSWSSGGGIAVWMRSLAFGLADRGHDVTVISRAINGRATVDFDQGVWVHGAPDADPAVCPTQTPFDMPEAQAQRAWAVNDEAARVRILRGLDVVLAPIWDLEGAALLTRDNGPLTITTLHTTYGLAGPHKPDWQAGGKVAAMSRKMVEAEVRVLSQAPHLLSNSRALIAALEASVPGLDLDPRTEIIAHGVDGSSEGASRSNGDVVRLLFVGRLETRKGAPELFEALPRVMEAAPNLRVDIVGEAVHETGQPIVDAFLAAHAGAAWLDRLGVRGKLDDDAAQALRDAADIIVVPSRFESFGLVYVEAMMAGVALIAADAGSVREVVGEPGEAAVLVPVGESDALASAIIELAGDRARRDRLGRAGRERALAHFTASQMLDRLEAWLGQRIRARSVG
ncbi:MAG TPA: glycosyltransferase family 4 protein, partial [Brevundimonas sp.]|uniref:glycosyltransferase family 4 protein n=1 Tax=Brevundimonas sp. TaxID=1871086 RepID=UPI002CE7572F